MPGGASVLPLMGAQVSMSREAGHAHQGTVLLLGMKSTSLALIGCVSWSVGLLFSKHVL